MTLTSPMATELFRRPADRHVDVHNGAAALRSVGTGPDVLLVHGWPTSGATFRALLPHLTRSFRCHVVDLPGAGDSRFDHTGRFGVADHARAVREILDALAVDDVAVVAHDSGGLIARHALAGDDRVRAWGLLDTEQPQGASLRFRSFLALRHAPRFEQTLAAVLGRPWLRRATPILGDSFRDRALLDGEFDEFFLRPLVSDPARLWAAGQFARSFDLAALDDLAALHRRIVVPVALVHGERNRFFPLARTREMAAGFGGPVSLHVVAGGRLFNHEEFPGEVASALMPVLGG